MPEVHPVLLHSLEGRQTCIRDDWGKRARYRRKVMKRGYWGWMLVLLTVKEEGEV
jgi:hypothetical protein